MSCPFPGMDPYIERPEIWGDFQWSFAVGISGLLQPLLRPRYASVVSRLQYGDKEGSFQLETYIVEPCAPQTPIVAIEIFPPENKSPGPGRSAYLAKREQYEASGVIVIEIDLLRGGQRIARLNPEKLDSLQPWRYLVAVSRWPMIHEIYAFPLERRLPKIAVPLAYDDHDVPLDLQAAFQRCWDEGPYPELLHYEGPAPGELTQEEQRWCREQLAKAGFTSSQ
jgi:hypothetical protein